MKTRLKISLANCFFKSLLFIFLSQNQINQKLLATNRAMWNFIRTCGDIFASETWRHVNRNSNYWGSMHQLGWLPAPTLSQINVWECQ